MKTVNVKSLGECSYLISLEPYDFIGRGSYATVNRAYNKENSQEKLAAKTFDLDNSKKFQSALKQLVIVSKIPNHPNLVEYKKIKITSKNRLYIIMQLCSESLQRKIDSMKNYLEQGQIWKIIGQICAGYKILQQKSIVHRDIKPDNILIGFDGNYKISDFGLSDIISEIEKQSKKAKGSLPFMAPELLYPQEYKTTGLSSMLDVYSLGVTIFYVCFKKFPYLKQSHKKVSISIYNFLKNLKENALQFPRQPQYSSVLLDLLKGCLEKSPHQRYSWEYVYFIVLERSNQLGKNREIQKTVENRSIAHRNFRIVEISDAFLKNLSVMDTDLYKSLSNQSIILIDHVEATIISKRQIIFFCDRLYYRMVIIRQKIAENVGEQSSQILTNFDLFCSDLLVLNYLNCKHLDSQFECFYSSIDRNQFLKCLTSHKYISIRNLIRQDLQFLTNNLQQHPLRNQILSIKSGSIKSKIQEFAIKVYEQCSTNLIALFQTHHYEQCKQLDELEKYLSKQGDSLLQKIRKNQNALKQFDSSIQGLSKDRLKQIISKQYLCPFRKIKV